MLSCGKLVKIVSYWLNSDLPTGSPLSSIHTLAYPLHSVIPTFDQRLGREAVSSGPVSLIKIIYHFV